MRRKRYSDDLNDAQWEVIEPYTRIKATRSGRKPLHSKRELLNAKA